MRSLGRFLLWQQLASPVHPEREAACRELGEAILIDREESLEELVAWLKSRRTESSCAEAFLPLVWAKLREPEFELPDFERLRESVPHQNVLASTLLEYLYGRSPGWNFATMFDSNLAPAERDKNRFFRILRQVAGYIRYARIPTKWNDFNEAFIREFAVVDNRLGHPDIDKIHFGQSGSEYIPNYETQAVDALISGFQRASASSVSQYGSSKNFEWYTSPVAPAWWLAPSEGPEPMLEDLFLAADISQTIEALEKLIEGKTWPARINARVLHNENKLTDLQITSFYQRVIGDGEPNPDAVFNAFRQPQLVLPHDEIPNPIPSGRLDEWNERVRGWEIWPATLCISMPWATVWHADICLREPAIPLIGGRMEVEPTEGRRGMRFADDNGDQIGDFRYWIVRPELMRPQDIPAPIGISTTMESATVRKTAAELRSVPALAIRRTTYERKSSYGEFDTSVDQEFLGTTSLLLP